MTNGSITDRYTLYSLIVRVLHALYWKVGRENKRKQIGTPRHIALRISDLQKQNHRFQQRPKLCSCIVFISDYQCIRCSASESDFKVVVLIGINERNIPSKVTEGYPFTGMDALDKKEFMSSKRSLLYVAITRAGQLVYMVVYGEPCGLVESIIED